MRRGRSHIGALIAKGDRDFATDVDMQIEAAVRDSLAAVSPDIPLLGEESDGEWADGEARWVLDPIDSTINFSKDSPLCSISLSLVVAGRPVLGIVDTPLLGERFVARQGGGAYLNGARIAVDPPVDGLHEAMVGLADFKVGMGSEEENHVTWRCSATSPTTACGCAMHGSAALDLAWLAAGRLHATAMLSNLPWDMTAGLLLVREAGGTVYDYDGSPHDKASRYTIASDPSLVEPLGQIVREAM